MPLGTNNPSSTEYVTPLVAATATVLPPHVYEVSTDPSVYRMAFHQGIWSPNDDSGFYNIHINDDYDSSDSDDDFVGGRGKIAYTWQSTGSPQPDVYMMQAHGFVNIPNGWKATKIIVDLRLDDGTKPPPGSPPKGVAIMNMYEVTTMTTADPIVAVTDGAKSLAGLTDVSEDTQAIANNEFTFTTGMVGQVDNAMWIIVNFEYGTFGTAGDEEYIAGGYITLEQV